MPGILYVIIFASATLFFLYENVKTKNFSKVFVVISIILFLNLISFYNPLKVHPPDVSEAYYAIAKNYMARRNYKDAITYFHAAIQVDSSNLSAYNEAGVILMRLGVYDKALEYFQKASHIDPQADNPKLNRDLVLKLMGNDKKMSLERER